MDRRMKRPRSNTATLKWAASMAVGTAAFLASPRLANAFLAAPVPSSVGHGGIPTGLPMAANSDALRTVMKPHMPAPPTPSEETDLLTAAAEYQRIKDLESDLAFHSAALKLPPLLDRAEAAGYGTDIGAYELAVSDGQKARDALVTRNMGLVHHVVTSIVGKNSVLRLNSLSRDDLVQEGAIGLSRAVKKYDAYGSNGARFSTYAVYWIRAAVLRCIAERDDMVRIPEYVSGSVRKLTAAASKLGIDLDEAGIIGAHAERVRGNGSSSAWKEAEKARLLAEEAGLTAKQLVRAQHVRQMRKGGGYQTFEPWMQGRMSERGRKETSLAVATPSGEDVSDREEIRRVLGSFLKPKEMEALSWRYGLNEFPEVAVTSRQQPPRRQGRDYEMEALEDLFGVDGILSQYSEEPLDSVAVKKIVMVKTNEKAAPAAAPAAGSPPVPQGGRWGEAMSFSEVGKKMAVSSEYGRRLCSQALRKLQEAADDGRLEMQPGWLSG